MGFDAIELPPKDRRRRPQDPRLARPLPLPAEGAVGGRAPREAAAVPRLVHRLLSPPRLQEGERRRRPQVVNSFAKKITL